MDGLGSGKGEGDDELEFDADTHAAGQSEGDASAWCRGIAGAYAESGESVEVWDGGEGRKGRE